MKGPRVPAAPVRAHVQHLLDQGMRQAAIYHAADTSSSALSALLYGQFTPGRPPQQTISADVAARLLAVEYQPTTPRPQPEGALCVPSSFEPVGFRTGRCVDCGQVAPVQTRHGVEMMFSHPRAPEPIQGLPTAAGNHPDCGHTAGAQRHRREGTELCGPCRYVTRGYDAGYKAATNRAAREARNAISAQLAASVVKAMRAVVYRRPYPQLRQLAATVVAIADAELYGNEKCEAVEGEVSHAA